MVNKFLAIRPFNHLFMLYNDEVLEHFKYPHNKGEIKHPSFSTSDTNSICGDEIKITANIKGGVIKDIKFSGSGCALVTASASLLTDYLKGKGANQLKEIDDKLALKLLGGQITPARISCALLPLKALKKWVFKSTKLVIALWILF